MEYTDFQLIWRFESMIFMAKHFFRERSLHTTVHKLRRRSGTLGDASRKKYFNDFLFHFDQKMRLALRSLTFQTFCIFRTAQPYVDTTQQNTSYRICRYGLLEECAEDLSFHFQFLLKFVTNKIDIKVHVDMILQNPIKLTLFQFSSF